MLLQGLTLLDLCVAEDLPEASQQPTEPPPPPQDPHIFSQTEDRSGQARVRGATRVSVSGTCSAGFSAAPSTSTPAIQGPSTSSALHPPVIGTEVEVETKVSRTTEWRHKKTGKKNKQRKTYSCRVCNQPMTSTGHTQFRGQRYCPNASGQISREEWLAARKEEAKAKAGAKKQ